MELNFRTLVLTAGLTLVSLLRVDAATLLVDNNSSHRAAEGGVIYRTAQEAHDAASDGDTLLFMGSSQRYGDLFLTKSLKLIGPGYDLAHNYPQKNTGLTSATFGSIYIDNREYDFSEAGPEFHGLVVQQIGPTVDPAGGASISNVIISHCRIIGSLDVNLSNVQANSWVIRKSWINRIENTRNANSWLIQNSIITSTSYIYNSSIQHCTFFDDTAAFYLGDSIVYRCILMAAPLAPFGISSTYNGCLYNSASGIIGGANLDFQSLGKSVDDVFIDRAGNFDEDKRLAIVPDLAGTVLGGFEPGAFGGPSPYRLSGIPEIPVIHEIEMPLTLTQGQEFEISLSFLGSSPEQVNYSWGANRMVVGDGTSAMPGNQEGLYLLNVGRAPQGLQHLIIQPVDIFGKQGIPAIVSVFVMPSVNRPPVSLDGSVQTGIGQSVRLPLQGNDPDNDPLVYSIVTQPENGSLQLQGDGSYTYTPNTGFFGMDRVVFTVSDGEVSSSPAEISIEVVRSNSAPVAVATSLQTGEGSPVTVQLRGTDPDNDPLSVTIVTPPSNGTLEFGAGGTYVYRPAPGFTGTDRISFTVSDGSLTSDPAEVVITVSSTNRPPVATASMVQTQAGQPVSLPLQGTDPDDDPLTVSIVTPPSNGTLEFGAGGTYRYRPNTGFTGTDQVIFTVSDGKLTSPSAAVTIQVISGNQPPVALAATVQTEAGQAVNLPLEGTDPDEDALTVTVVAPPSNGTLELGAGGTYLYRPGEGFTGTDRVGFTVSDGQSTSEPAQVIIEVLRRNAAPIATQGSVSVDKNTSVLIDVGGSDPDGDSLDFEIIVQPTNGRLVRVDFDSFRYTPNRDFTGTDQFRFIADDGRQKSPSAIFTISVRETGSVSVSEYIPLRILSYDQNGIRFQLDSGFSTGEAQLWYADSLPLLITDPQPVLSLQAPLDGGHQFQLDIPQLDLDSPDLSAFFLAELISSANSDTQGPLISITSPEDESLVSDPTVTIIGTVSDADRGGNGVQQLTVNGQSVPEATASGDGVASWQTSVNLVAGENTVEIEARDSLGNQSARSLTVFYQPKDVQNPSLVISSPTPDSTVNSPNLLVTGTATDDQRGASGIARVIVNGEEVPESQINGAGILSWQVSITLSTGINPVEVRAIDGAGNETVTQMTVQYQPLDTMAPTLTVNSPENGTTVTDSDVVITGTATDAGQGNSGIGFVSVNGQSIALATASGDGTATWQATVNLAAGENTIEIEARDRQGNQTTRILTIVYEPPDVQEPELVITSPTPNSRVNSPSLQVTGTATDAGRGGSGISMVTINGRELPEGRISGSEILSWQMTITLTSGINPIEVRAIDGAGNETVTLMTVQYQPLDNTAPQLTVTSPSNATSVTESGVLITGTATDAGRGNSGISSVTVNGTAVEGASTGGSGTVNWEFPASLNLGVNQFNITATDMAGNSVEASLTVTRLEGGPQPPVPGQSFVIDSLNLRMIWVEPGSFMMGSPSGEVGRFENESLHQVTLTAGYWIAETELTVAQYQLITGTPDSGTPRESQLPVTDLSWNEANGICETLNQSLSTYLNATTGFSFALPSEAQWEFAARGGANAPDSSPFSTGQNLSHEQANFDARINSNSQEESLFREQLVPVGGFQPNRLGLYDIHGNAWEWCSDWFSDYQGAAVSDPVGPSNGTTKVMRGGSWSLPLRYARTACRGYAKTNIQFGPYGMRLVINTTNP